MWPGTIPPKAFSADTQCLAGPSFNEQKLTTNLDCSAMIETILDTLFNASLTQNDELRNLMDTICCVVFNLSCEKDFQTIIGEVNWKLREKPETVTLFVDSP